MKFLAFFISFFLLCLTFSVSSEANLMRDGTKLSPETLEISKTAIIEQRTEISQPTIQLYYSLDDFVAAVGKSGTDKFTGFSTRNATPSPINRSAGGFDYVGVSNSSFFGAGTAAQPWLSTNIATAYIKFTNFTNGVVAAGGNFFGSSVAGKLMPGDVKVTATDNFGATSRILVNATVDSFLGFVSSGSLESLTVVSLISLQPCVTFIWPTVSNLILAEAAESKYEKI